MSNENIMTPSTATDASCSDKDRCGGGVTGSVTSKEIASESCHFYDMATGEPRYTVLCKNGKERNAHIGDARKNNWCPSVTQIIKDVMGVQPGLLGYLERQMFDATAVEIVNWIAADEYLDLADEQSRDILFSKCREQSKEHSRRAAEQGTSLHGAIEGWIRGEPVSSKWEEHIDVYNSTLLQYGIDVLQGDPEKSFAHEMGFGGKVDWNTRMDAGIVLDNKSKPRIVPGKQYGYDNHVMQLAAYSMGLGMPYARGINVFVGVEDKKVLIHEWSSEELSRGWDQFALMLALWKSLKRHYPRK